MKQLSKLFGFTFLLCLPTYITSAQTVNPSALADTMAGSSSNTYAVNCDMVQCPMFSDQFLKAIVWDERTGGSTSYLFVDFNGTQLGTIMSMPNASFPDVVIGDNMGNPGNEYTIAVAYMVYGNPNQVFIQSYNVDLNMLTLTANGAPVQISDPTQDAKYSHIDLFADLAAPPIGTLRPLHKYVICWQGGTNYNAVVGDINNLTGPVTTFLPISGTLADVAALTDLSGNDSACFIHSFTSSNVIDVWDVTTTTPVAGSNTVLAGGDYPRIEAMNVYDGTSAMYQAVFTSTVGFNTQIETYNDISGAASYYAGSLAGNFPVYPVVAAGVGSTGCSGCIGNTQYTYSFNRYNLDIIAQDIDITTGIPATATDFEAVNNSGGTPAYGGDHAAHALSSSSNSGFGLLSAFYDGSDIYYKVSSTTTFGFKTNFINKIDTKTGFSIYPNPATDYLHINAPSNYEFTITDLGGRTYIQAKSTGKPIDIKELPAGLYIIDIHNDTDRRVLKFTKQ